MLLSSTTVSNVRRMVKDNRSIVFRVGPRSSGNAGNQLRKCRTRCSLTPKPKKSRRLVRARKLCTKSSTAEKAVIKAPSTETLHRVLIRAAVPMIGFGFMDNFVLIVAGDYIDSTIGVTLGISTMCAAALGNIVSDLCGVPAGSYIEGMADKMKLPRPRLTHAQETLASVRYSRHTGIGVGLVIGCVLGMVPLLFMDSDKALKSRAKAKLNQAFADVMQEVAMIMDCDRAAMYLLDEETGETWTRIGKSIHTSKTAQSTLAHLKDKDKEKELPYSDSQLFDDDGNAIPQKAQGSDGGGGGGVGGGGGTAAGAEGGAEGGERATVGGFDDWAPEAMRTVRFPKGAGITGHVCATGKTMNVPDAYKCKRFDGIRDRAQNYRTVSILSSPLFNREGRVIGALTVLNKKDRENSGDPQPFNRTDELRLQAACSHIALAVEETLLMDDPTAEFGKIDLAANIRQMRRFFPDD